MTQIDQAEWNELLRGIERQLATLSGQGVRWLNVPPDEQLASLLEDENLQLARPEPVSQPEELLASPRPRQVLAPEAEPAAPGAMALEPAAPGAPIAKTPPAILTAPDLGKLTSSLPPATAPVGPPPSPADLATLESLRFQYRDCQQCGLGAGRNRLVFGTGADRPRLLLIGEGPGAEEDQQGLPFVGRAGVLLTGLIQAMGLVREDVYITNVVKCRPPGNRNPEPNEVASCLPILKRQIELLAPTLIVTLGNVPLKALNPEAGGITRERGRIFQFGAWRVLPTFHPSYLLRSPAGIGDCWRDFRQAMEMVASEMARP